MKEQFDCDGNAEIKLNFAEKTFFIQLHNPMNLSYGEYIIKRAVCDHDMELINHGEYVSLQRDCIATLDDSVHRIEVELGKK